MGAFSTARSNHFSACHAEETQDIRAGLLFLSSNGSHELGYTGTWRQLTNLSDGASSTVRERLGDSVKSSTVHTYTQDSRDNKLFPSSGSLLRNTAEFAGLGGDVSLLKDALEASHSLHLTRGISFSAGLRARVIPLPGSPTATRPPVPHRRPLLPRRSHRNPRLP